jgi:hypothetical protein
MNKLKSAIFDLGYKRFGTYAEIFMKKHIGAEFSGNSKWDLNKDGQKIECKFTRAQQEAKRKITEENILEVLYDNACRDVLYDTCELSKWDCNFQQIKKDLFDVLYYGIFFSDCLVVYCINSEDINKDINYCNKQHRGNVGEGQFHINQRNIGLHDKHLYSILSYEEIEECLKLH